MTAAVAGNGYNNYFRPSSSGASDTSKRLAEFLKSVLNHTRSTAHGSQWENLHEELLGMAAERSCVNWDDQGAQPIAELALEEALLFLDNLPSWIPLPDVVPEPDGSIGLEWYKAPDKQFAISFGGQGSIAFAGLLGNGRRINGIEDFEGTLSPYIQESIDRVTN